MQLEISPSHEVRFGVSFVHSELDWLEDCIQHKLAGTNSPMPLPYPPENSPGKYAQFLVEKGIGRQTRLILALGLASELRPSILIRLLDVNKGEAYHGIQYLESSKEFVPTIHTARLLLGEQSQQILELFFASDSPLIGPVIDIRRSQDQFTNLSTKFGIAAEFMHTIVWERPYVPGNFFSFPAQRSKTNLEWRDLVISPQLETQIEDIDLWLKYGQSLSDFWTRGHHFKPGYRVLFYGPPGTGKTLTATLLGKENNREVYRVDLSQVVSKYIGETEKQLKKLFDKAANRDWILFFDEADSLFGKRGKVSEARDRYANQEISYLLQRVEDFNGLVILATNLKDNMDKAFIRRFQSVIHFSKPGVNERLRLWKNALPDQIPLSPEVDLHQVSQDYDLTGASIVNVVHYISLRALNRTVPQISAEDIVQGVRLEYGKDNRLL